VFFHRTNGKTHILNHAKDRVAICAAGGGMEVELITSAMIDDYMNINMAAADMEKLTDIRTLEFDNSLPKEKRLTYVLEKLKNPLCFRCGDTGVKLEFDDAAPPIQEVLTNFMIRKKSGL
jgi:hypothetical protein